MRWSTTQLKRSGAAAHPCLTPLLMLNHSESSRLCGRSFGSLRRAFWTASGSCQAHLFMQFTLEGTHQWTTTRLDLSFTWHPHHQGLPLTISARNVLLSIRPAQAKQRSMPRISHAWEPARGAACVPQSGLPAIASIDVSALNAQGFNGLSIKIVLAVNIFKRRVPRASIRDPF